MTHLNVAETFGPTLQGEGPRAGQLASFLRLSGCNLSCSWCDTPFTWDWSRYDRDDESDRLDVDDVAATLSTLPGRIVVSGGEPLLQSTGLAELGHRRGLEQRQWDVETNGTRSLGATDWLWDTIIVSPKVGPTAQQDVEQLELHIDPSDRRTHWKYVVGAPRDFAAAEQHVDEYGIDPSRVWIMPEGTDRDTINARWRWVAEAAIDRRFNATQRLHVLAWGDERRR